jgi:hypothetical protein
MSQLDQRIDPERTERTSGVTRALVMELAPMRSRQLIAAPGSSSRSSRACSAA